MWIDVLHELSAIVYSLQKEHKPRASLLMTLDTQKSTKIMKINTVSSNGWGFRQKRCRTIPEKYPDLQASRSIYASFSGPLMLNIKEKKDCGVDLRFLKEEKSEIF